MARVTDIPGTRPGLGAPLGQALGSGLGLLLGHMIQKKLAKKQQAQTASGLQALGIPTREAQQISLLPPQLQQTVVQNYMKAAEGAGLSEALADISWEGVAREPVERFEPETPAAQVLESFRQQPPSVTEGFEPGSIIPARLPQIAEAVRRQEAPIERRPVEQRPAPKRQTFSQLISKPRLSREDKLKIHELKQKKRQFERKMSLQEKKFASKKQEKIDAETKKTYEDVISKYKGAKESNMRLARMKKLNETGKLARPTVKAVLDTVKKGIGGIYGVGIDLSGLILGPESQEFEKLSIDFTKNVKDIFGTRVTQSEVQLFLKSIPSLLQTKEGRSRVIRNLKLFNQGALLRKNAMDEIIRLNRGERPKNLASMIERKISPQLDAITRKFAEGKKRKKRKAPVNRFAPKELLKKPEADPLTALRDILFTR